MAEVLTVGILVVSDTAHADPSTDAATAALEDVFAEIAQTNVKWEVHERQIIPDDVHKIQKVVKHWADDRQHKLNLVVLSGGTGFAVKDVTPEAITPLIQKHAPGIVHGMLSASLAITPFAMMSRPVAGVRNSTLIVTLPGSPKGAKENLQAILRLLPHACIQAAGGDSRKIHSKGLAKLEKEAGVAAAGVAAAAGATDRNDDGSSQKRGHHHHHHHHHHGHATPRARTTEGLSMEKGTPVSRRYRSSPYEMIPVAEAQNIISLEMPSQKTRKAAVDSLLSGYVLAEDVVSAEDVPGYRASIVDGYAVVHSDGKGVYPVTAVSHASPGEVTSLKPGQIARITTGAPLPPGATAVVMVEDTLLKKATEDGKEELEVEVLIDDTEEGENVREVGSDVKTGDMVLQKGTEISAVGGEVGLLASIGMREVEVFGKPVVGVLSTGNEVVDHHQEGFLKYGQIRDSNRPTLLAISRALGYETWDLGIAHDTMESLESTLRDAFKKVDVIITTGGVSMGELDLLKPTIERSLNGKIHFGRVAMKPGKPTTFATVDAPPEHNSEHRLSSRKVIFSLPGNPASAVVTFHLFVLPALRQLSGYNPPDNQLPKTLVTTTDDLRLDERPEYHRAVVRVNKSGQLEATSTGGQRSSRIGSMVAANALLCLPGLGEVGDKRKRIPAGDKVEAILIAPLR